MKKLFFSLITLASFGLLTGCMASMDPQDGAEPAVGEAQQTLVTALGCTIIGDSVGQAHAKLTNPLAFTDIEDATIHLSVHHDFTTATYDVSLTHVNILAGDTYNVSTSADPNVLSETTCTANAIWFP